jgi:argininosuccinate lyase
VDSVFLDEAAVEYLSSPLRLSEREIREVLDPVRAVQARRLIGGTAPDEVERQLAACLKHLESDREILAGRRRKLADAAARLEHAIDAIVA